MTITRADIVHLIIKIDNRLLSFFQGVVHLGERIRISSLVFINLFLIIQISAQLTQIILAYLIHKSLSITFFMAFPTWLAIIYFFEARRRSKRVAIPLDYIRLFSVALLGIELFSFFTRLGGGFLFHYLHPGVIHVDEPIYDEIAYMIAWTAFPCALYFLSTHETNQKLLKRAKSKTKPA